MMNRSRLCLTLLINLLFLGVVNPASSAGSFEPAYHPEVKLPEKFEVFHPSNPNPSNDLNKRPNIHFDLNRLSSDDENRFEKLKKLGFRPVSSLDQKWFKTEEFPGIQISDQVLLRDISWLTAPLAHRPLIISLVEPDNPLSKELVELASRKEIPEVIQSKATRKDISDAIEYGGKDRLTLVFFHKPNFDGKDYVSDLSEREKILWSDIQDLFGKAGDAVFAFSCESSCLTENKVGLDKQFDEFQAINVFRRINQSKTIADVLTALHEETKSNVKVSGEMSAAALMIIISHSTGDAVIGYVPAPPANPDLAGSILSLGIDFCDGEKDKVGDELCYSYICNATAALRASSNSHPLYDDRIRDCSPGTVTYNDVSYFCIVYKNTIYNLGAEDKYHIVGKCNLFLKATLLEKSRFDLRKFSDQAICITHPTTCLLQEMDR
jgi:hypothetical protein